MKTRTIFKFLFGVLACFGLVFMMQKSCRDKPCKKKHDQLVINLGSPPLELHPHFLRDVHSAFLAIHLYEGLFRLGPNGSLLPGLAEQFFVSEDGLNYRVKLRTSYWSNGLPLKASDFIRSWRNVIAPGDRLCIPGMHFDLILGVKKFRDGLASWSSVSLSAENDQILVFSLKHPVPYFQELLTLPIFFPVYPDDKRDELITNGPFFLKNSKWGQEMVLEKNPYYWDAASVFLSKIKVLFIEEANTQMILFEQGEIDCIGGGLLSIPQEAADNMKDTSLISDQYDVDAITYLSLNTLSGPFTSDKIRQAFSMGLNRDLLAQGLFKRSLQAYSYLPPPLSSRKNQRLIQESSTIAKKLLQEGLEEKRLSLSNLGEIRLLCSESGSKLAQALQQQWAERLGVLISIETVEFRVLLSRLTDGDFNIAITGSVADYRDPYTFFENFIHGDYPSNYTGWSPSYFCRLFYEGLNLQGEQRSRHIEVMEDFVLAEMPLIPIAFPRELCAMRPGLKGIHLSEMLMLDFSKAYWDQCE